jgi:hypothetical protein
MVHGPLRGGKIRGYQEGMNNSSPAAPPRFDSNRAWQEASSAVMANRDMLIALAGVFIALPAFALTVLVPPPEPAPGANMDAVLELLGAYFQEKWPAYVLVALFNTVGTMAMLALIGLARRPTVGEAIKQGLVTAPISIAVQLLQGFLLTGAVMLPSALLGLTGSPGLAVVGMLIGIGVAIYLAVRLSLANPVIAVEGIRNPIAALQRSFALTQANVGRLLVFFVLLVLAFAISLQLIQLVVGLLAQLVAGAEPAKLIAALTGAALSAVMTVYLLAAGAMSYRQLAGTATIQSVVDKFE